MNLYNELGFPALSDEHSRSKHGPLAGYHPYLPHDRVDSGPGSIFWKFDHMIWEKAHMGFSNSRYPALQLFLDIGQKYT